MAQQNIVKRAARVELAREVTYGTTPGTMYVARPKDPGVNITLTQENLDNEGQSTRMFDALTTVQGLRDWTAEMPLDIRVESTQLIDGATPPVSYMTELLETICGGSHIDEGDTIASSTTSSVTVSDGTRFAVGTPIAAEVSGNLEVAIVTAISTNTLTCWPNFSGAPTTTTGIVVNSCANWLTDTNSKSLAMTAAYVQSSDLQYTLNCGIPEELSISIPQVAKGLITGSVKLKGKTWTGPSDQSLGTGVIVDPLLAPVSMRAATFLLQPLATTTRVTFDLISIDIKLVTGMMHVEEFSGENEQTSGVMRMSPRVVGNATIKCRFNPTIETYYSSQTPLSLLFIAPYGSGLSKRFIVFHMATCFIDAKPMVVDEGGRAVHQFNLRAQLSALNASSTAGTAAAPWVLGRI